MHKKRDSWYRQQAQTKFRATARHAATLSFVPLLLAGVSHCLSANIGAFAAQSAVAPPCRCRRSSDLVGGTTQRYSSRCKEMASEFAMHAHLRPWQHRRQAVLAGVAVTAVDVDAPTAAARAQRSMGDGEILGSLRAQHGWEVSDMGAGGNCLFLSISPQVLADDVAELSSRSPTWSEALPADLVQRWQGLSVPDRARILRRVAILQEREFLGRLSKFRAEGREIPPSDAWTALELFKDMAEEFISTGDTDLAAGINRWDLPATYRRVRQAARDTPPDQVQDFVLKHADEYTRRTGTEGNWAGSSEMIALSTALGRPFVAYGNNWVSQDAVEVEELDNAFRVLPYFNTDDCPGAVEAYRPAAKPVRVFQTRGGGHYQMLS